MGIISNIINSLKKSEQEEITTYQPIRQKKENAYTPYKNKNDVSQHDVHIDITVGQPKIRKIKRILNSEYIPYCPHCNQKLKQLPKRQKKCEHCKLDIFVRSNMEVYDRPLLTEHEAIATDTILSLEIPSNEYLAKLKQNNNDPVDTIIKMCDEKEDEILATIKTQEDELNKSHTLLMLLLYKASFLLKIGQDPTEAKTKQSLYQLWNQKSIQMLSGYTPVVKIDTSNCCPNCNELDGKIMQLNEALQSLDLPNPNCTRKYKNKDKYKYSWCVCSYTGVSREER